MTLMAPVCRALDALIASAEPYHGLFSSLLDRRTGAMLRTLPVPIAGQRNNDRAPLGSNLIHDAATLATLYALDAALGRREYGAAADRYLRRFAGHCTATATGLFPWGEHSFWHLLEDRVGNSYADAAGQHLPVTHDHLRQAPTWLWEKLQAFNPGCVERFAEGLDYHWQAGLPREYIRHARIAERERPERGARSCDFPRHGGFYILDWAFAWRQTGRPDFLTQIQTMLDYGWAGRDARGLLLIESRCPPDSDPAYHGINAPGQTLSLAASLLESADLLDAAAPPLADQMRRRAHVYIEGFLAAPHDPARGVFALLSRRADNTLFQAMPVWGSAYSVWPAAYVGLTALCVYRRHPDARLLDWAAAVGAGYAREPLPAGVAVPAMDAGLALGLLADLFDITGRSVWIERAMQLAGTLVAVYCDAPLPRGAADIDWYESQMGPGFLLHGLARTALLAQAGRNVPLAADYTAR